MIHFSFLSNWLYSLTPVAIAYGTDVAAVSMAHMCAGICAYMYMCVFVLIFKNSKKLDLCLFFFHFIFCALICPQPTFCHLLNKSKHYLQQGHLNEYIYTSKLDLVFYWLFLNIYYFHNLKEVMVNASSITQQVQLVPTVLACIWALV